MLAGDVEGVEEFLKANSNYGPLFCAWERIKKELSEVQKPSHNSPMDAIAFVKQFAINSRCTCVKSTDINCPHCVAERIAQRHQ